MEHGGASIETISMSLARNSQARLAATAYLVMRCRAHSYPYEWALSIGLARQFARNSTSVSGRQAARSMVLEPVRSPAAERGVLLQPHTPKRCEGVSARKTAFRRT
jgi:hypothetical protein